MKTTVEIPDTLLDEARKVASAQNATLRELIIEGLREVLAKRRRGEPFRLRKVTYRGKGLQPPMVGASWERLRQMTYEGRGG